MEQRFTYGRVPADELAHYINGGCIVEISGALVEMTSVERRRGRIVVTGRKLSGPVQPMTFAPDEQVRIALPHHPRPELDGVDLLAVADSLRRKE